MREKDDAHWPPPQGPSQRQDCSQPCRTESWGDGGGWRSGVAWGRQWGLDRICYQREGILSRCVVQVLDVLKKELSNTVEKKSFISFIRKERTLPDVEAGLSERSVAQKAWQQGPQGFYPFLL